MALEVIDLKRDYGRFSLSVDFNVSMGETLALVGPSGSGKTTSLNLIAGLVAPDSGKVIIDGEDVSDLPSWKRNISLVFQDLALFPHLDVGGNISYGLFIHGIPRNERKKIINETLKIVRLPGYASRRIQTLSGGERQRVAIARSLASNPRVLLLDEPFSSLDLPLRQEMRREFLEIRAQSRTPCVFVTHDRDEAAMLGDRIALMSEGRIIESGTGTDLFLAPKTAFAARFFGVGVLLPSRIFGNSEEEEEAFVPHDAIRLDDQKYIESNPGAHWKTIKAKFCGAVFEGSKLTIKLILPASEISGEFGFEAIASPRFKPPAPGSEVKLWIDESLVKFVK